MRPVLQVEPTDRCNLACAMCAPHAEGWETVHAVPKGAMDPALWARIVEGLVAADVRLDHLIFQWLGEPTLHPGLADMVALAARRLAGRVGYLRVDTNALRLAGPTIEGLLDAASAPGGPPLLVVLSLDAATAETYARVKGRDAFALARDHARMLLRRRRRRGPACKLNVQFQFVVQAANAHEVGPFLAYWGDLVACQGGDWHDEVLFKRLSVGGGAAGQAAADRVYERALAAAGVRAGRRGAVEVKVWERRPWQRDDGHDGERGPCAALWLTPVIRHDGHLVMCCADLRGETDLGSLAEHRFDALWEGAAATRRRLDHLAGRFEGVCATCGGVNWYAVTDEMAAETRRRAARLGLANAPGPTPNRARAAGSAGGAGGSGRPRGEGRADG